jgi:hypothetical protein
VLKGKVGVKGLPETKKEDTPDPDAVNFEQPKTSKATKTSRKLKDVVENEEGEGEDEGKDDETEKDEEEPSGRRSSMDDEDEEEPHLKKTTTEPEILTSLVKTYFVPDPTDEEVNEVVDPEQLSYPRRKCYLEIFTKSSY